MGRVPTKGDLDTRDKWAPIAKLQTAPGSTEYSPTHILARPRVRCLQFHGIMAGTRGRAGISLVEVAVADSIRRAVIRHAMEALELLGASSTNRPTASPEAPSAPQGRVPHATERNGPASPRFAMKVVDVAECFDPAADPEIQALLDRGWEPFGVLVVEHPHTGDATTRVFLRGRLA